MAVNIAQVVASVRTAFNSGVTRPVEWRMHQLQGILKAVSAEHEADWADALRKDLGSDQFFIGSEVGGVQGEVKDAIKNLHKWVKPEKLSVPLMQLPASVEIVHDPFGVVLVIAPWNYPVTLVFNVVVAAVAAGNAVVIKPSELAPHTAAVVERLCKRYLDNSAIVVVQGGVPETTELLRLRFDKIFYTGNTNVGRIVMEAAAKHLTPVTLELGGKSPCFIDQNIDLDLAAKRIVWGGITLNAGQTCVRPDYIITTPNMEARVIAAFTKEFKRIFGDDAKKCECFTRIISERHTQRLANMLEGENGIVFGGQVDIKQRYIAPTLVKGVRPESKLMQEEIFGPILPIMVLASDDEAISYINAHEKPLALYVFSNNKTVVNKFLSRTSSGSVAVNDCVMQVAFPNHPFGGVGHSGMGNYHGIWGFNTFTHSKTVLRRGLNKYTDAPIRYAPYSPTAINIVRFLRGVDLDHIKSIAVPIVVAAVAAGAAYFGGYL